MRYSYTFDRADLLGWNPAGAFASELTRMSRGRTAFSALKNSSFPSVGRIRKPATCSKAWTPASVRPAPLTETLWRVTLKTASSSAPWIVLRSGCLCQPW